MEMQYDPHAPWPLPVFAKFVETREREGYHLIYKNGSVQPFYEVNVDQMGYIAHGWTVRVFMFRITDTSYSSVYVKYSDRYFSSVYFDQKDTKQAIIQEYRGVDPHKRAVLVQSVKAGEVFSMAIRRLRDRYFQPIGNDVVGDWANLHERTRLDQTKFIINSSTNPVLSIHITNDLETTYGGVNRKFRIQFKLEPPGSCVIVSLKLTDEKEDVQLGVDPEDINGSSVEYHNYGKLDKMKHLEPFTVYVRSVPGRYIMTTSFDPLPRIINQKAGGKDNIFFYASTNCTIVRRTHHVVGFKEPEYK